MARLMRLFMSLPRSGRWLAGAVLFFVAYFAVIEPALELTQRWRFEGDALQSALDDLARRRRDSDSEQSEFMRAAALFAPIRFPADSQSVAEQELNRRIVEIFREHGVEISVRERRAVASIGRDALAGVVGPEQEARRLIIDVEFTAAPETAVAIISALESSGVVHAIGRVHIERSDGGRRTVRVNVSPETWFIAERAS